MYKAGRIILAVCIVLGVLVSSGCFGAEVSGDNSGAVMEFQLANTTGKTIREIWLGPSGRHYCFGGMDRMIRWGPPLRSGRYATISVDLKGRENERYWDLRVDFAEGGKKEWHKIDMWSGIRQIEITQSLQLRYQR